MPVVLTPQILSVSRAAGAWSSWAAAPVGAVDPSTSCVEYSSTFYKVGS